MHTATDFQTLFKAAGYTAMPDAKGRHIDGMIHLLGGLEGVRALRDETLLQLLMRADVRKGAAYTLAEMRAFLPPDERLPDKLHHLAGIFVFWRGCALSCPHCDLSLWYPVKVLDEYVICEGCRQAFQLPVQVTFSYRLNPLFMAGINQGALTVLLTLLYLHEKTAGEFQWVSGYRVRGHGMEAEIDLIAMTPDGLLLIECKDTLPKMSTLEGQLARGQVIAARLGGRLWLTTLSQQGEGVTLTRGDLV